ncbi:fatty-acid--CoA ligase, partial [Aeromicrobium phragmitis]
VNHKLTVPEVRYAVEHSGAVVGVVAADLASIATDAASGITWMTTEAVVDGLEAFDELAETCTPIESAVDDDIDAPAQYLFTSGTTSSPKACVHTHRTISSASPLMVSTLGFTRDERFLIAMPIWHAAPLNCWFLTMMFLGATVILQREYHPVQMLQNVQR